MCKHLILMIENDLSTHIKFANKHDYNWFLILWSTCSGDVSHLLRLSVNFSLYLDALVH
jgi:hypothetical protein